MVGALFNVPGPMTGAAFAMMNPVGTLQKYTQGVLRSLGTTRRCAASCAWRNGCTTSLTTRRKAARQGLDDLYQDNKLVRGELELGNQRVDLHNVRAPVLNIYATDDMWLPRRPRAGGRRRHAVLYGK